MISECVREIPLRPEPRARETGSNIQPRLSLMKGEGNNPDLNLIKFAFLSSSLLHFASWVPRRLAEDKWEARWSLRETHVSKRKIESKKGKACGFFKKCLIDDNLEKFWNWIGFSELFEYEILLGFAIVFLCTAFSIISSSSFFSDHDLCGCTKFPWQKWEKNVVQIRKSITSPKLE